MFSYAVSIKKIGIFDSGVGGFIVLRYLQKVFPAEYIYLADTKNFPYGGKSPEQLKDICEQNIEILLAQKVDIIVFACHTMSCLTIDQMREKFKIPLISVTELLIKHTLDQKIKSVGVLATQATIASHIFLQKLSQSNLQVFEQSCPGLADLIEMDAEKQQIRAALEKWLISLFNHHIDTLILGCTHYEMIQNLIREMIPKNILIISLLDSINILVKPWKLDNTLISCKIISTLNDDFILKVPQLLSRINFIF